MDLKKNINKDIIINMKKNIFIVFIILLLIISCKQNSDNNDNDDNNGNGAGYPKLAMWWPNIWEQPVSDLKRYDYIGFGEWDVEEIDKIREIKRVNPTQKQFMNYTITETNWDWWREDCKISNIDKVPAEWFLTQVGSYLIEDINSTKTGIRVKSLFDKDNNPLFEKGDTLVCEYESMKLIDIDYNNNELIVQRGFVRAASSHEKGTRIAAHITCWPKTWVMNMSTMCPKVDVGDGNGKQNWIEFAINNYKVEYENEWDGYIVDRIEHEESWLTEESARTIDPDCSNTLLNDYSNFNNKWYEGCKSLLEYLRERFKDKYIISNSFGYYYKLLNGTIFEGCPTNWENNVPESYADWGYYVLGEHGYINISKVGYSPNFSLVETYEIEEYIERKDNPFNNPDWKPNYQRMRYGLTTALLGNGYFSYEINTNGHGGLGLMWFDEYDNSGKKRGYLGLPLKDAEKILKAGDGWVWRREFEKGVVICNPTNKKVTIALDDTYYLIEGKQVPEINTGEAVNSIVLKPRDGRILLKEKNN
jgi:hypothetical protein